LNGVKQPADAVFFLPAPPEIGEVWAGGSTMTAKKKPKSFLTRLLIYVIVTAIPVFGILMVIFFADDDHRAQFWTGTALLGVLMWVGFSLLTFPIVWLTTRYVVWCAYIGKEGAVKYTVKGKPGSQAKGERILFAQAAELRTSQTRKYVNGAYTGTSYNYRWTDERGRPVLNLSGTYNSKEGTPKQKDPYYFAQGAEIAWSQYMLARADTELAQNGCLRFVIDAKKAVVIGPGYIEFHFGGRVDRCEAGDIKTIDLQQGQFTIKHRDAKWYSSKGKFSFPYGQMGNARLFLIVLDKFLPRSTWAK
jgi:hypothetical protein